MCMKFTCKNSTENYYQLESTFCPENLVIDEHDTTQNHNVLQENSRDYKAFDNSQQQHSDNSTEIFSESQTEPINELIEPEKLVSSTATSSEEEINAKLLLTTALSTKIDAHGFSQPITSRTTLAAFSSTTTTATTTPRMPSFYKPAQNYTPHWRMRNRYTDLQYAPSSPYQTTDYFSSFSPSPTAMIMTRDKWRNKSGCYFSCVQYSKGLQTVVSKYDYSSSIRLCEPTNIVSIF
jgi:hypothetical protein